MAETPEGWVKAHIKTILTYHKVYYTMPVTMGYGKSGDPDFHTCMQGQFVTIEAKDDALRHRRGELTLRGKNKGTVVRAGGPTALQQDAMWHIRQSLGCTLLLDRHNFTKLHDFIIALQYPPKNIPDFFCWAREQAIALDIWYERMPIL